MRRLLLASSMVFATGCAAATQNAAATTRTSVAQDTSESRLNQLEAESAGRQDRIRHLEGQLALSRAEAEELRASRLAIPSTVRIGEGPAAPSDDAGWVSDDGVPASEGHAEGRASSAGEEPSGPRPLLRLYGSPAASLDGSMTAPVDDLRRTAPPLPLLPGPIPPPGSAPATAPAPRSNPSDAHAVARYRAALEHVRARRLDQATIALTGFIQELPNHPYADNALYWRGEVLYALRRYPEALRDFERVVREHPRGNKVPDALLKIGLCHRQMGDAVRARAYFRRLRDEHPDSVAARLAIEEDAS
ncbi:MAG: tol-pal system protein YbgF [Polyangiaceae bacterium]|nr:tol-pal system protein YbgF [Polyangiaceae bacterium]